MGICGTLCFRYYQYYNVTPLYNVFDLFFYKNMLGNHYLCAHSAFQYNSLAHITNPRNYSLWLQTVYNCQEKEKHIYAKSKVHFSVSFSFWIYSRVSACHWSAKMLTPVMGAITLKKTRSLWTANTTSLLWESALDVMNPREIVLGIFKQFWFCRDWCCT